MERNVERDLKIEMERFRCVIEHETRVHEERMAAIFEGGKCTTDEGQSACVTLNVGGSIFTFGLESLRQPYLVGSFLETAFSQRWRGKQSLPVFVDRDARLFSRYIAPYIRGHHKTLHFREEDCEALLLECDFFILEGLAQLVYSSRVRWVMTETPNGALSGGGITLTHVLHGDCISVGSVPLLWGKTHVLTFKLDSGGLGALVGVANSNGIISKVASHKNVDLRWRLSCESGRVACPGEVRGETQLSAFREPLPKDSIVRIKIDETGAIYFSVNASPWESGGEKAVVPKGVSVVPLVHLNRINSVISLL